MTRMKKFLTLMGLLMALALAACGPSEADLNATSTQVAADIFATQTAEAPTATQTATPTSTATQTPSPSPTLTSTPTLTPTITPTPRPDLAMVALTLEDLPSGFHAVPPSEQQFFEPGEIFSGGIIEDAYEYSTDEGFTRIAGASFLLPDAAARLEYDALIPAMNEAMLSGMGAVLGGEEASPPEDLPGFEEIGEASKAGSINMDMGILPLRVDLAQFRRGDVGVILLMMTIGQETPPISLAELAETIDGRIQSHFPQGD